MTTPQQKQTPRFFKIAQMIGIVGVTLLILNFIYQVWHLHSINETKTKTNACDLMVGSCTKQLPNNQTLELSITPRPIQINAASTITVSLTGITPDKVAVLLFPYPATSSSSPTNRPILLKLQKSGTYTGTMLITKTSNAKQKWIAMVVLQKGSQQISAPFRFEINNHYTSRCEQCS